MSEIIRITNLGFDYGEGWVFHKLNLNIEKGDFVAVIGANGAGKSTLLKMLANVVTPTQGEIQYYNLPVADFHEWEKIGYVPQNPARQQRNFPISVREVIELGLIHRHNLLGRINSQDRQMIDKMLTDFDLTALQHRKIGELSGGQQQRVFLARAMVKQPEILLLDEPATGIDTQAKTLLYGMLKKINRENGVTIVMVSHDLELAAETARNALCLDHGICFWGEVHAALKHHHKHGYFYR